MCVNSLCGRLNSVCKQFACETESVRKQFVCETEQCV